MYAIKDEHRHMHPGSLPFLSSDEGTFDPESLMLLVPGRVMAKMPKASLLKNSNQAAEVPGNEWMPENLEDMEILVYNGTQSSGELFGDVDWSEHTVENDSLVVTDST